MKINKRIRQQATEAQLISGVSCFAMDLFEALIDIHVALAKLAILREIDLYIDSFLAAILFDAIHQYRYGQNEKRAVAAISIEFEWCDVLKDILGRDKMMKSCRKFATEKNRPRILEIWEQKRDLRYDNLDQFICSNFQITGTLIRPLTDKLELELALMGVKNRGFFYKLKLMDLDAIKQLIKEVDEKRAKLKNTVREKSYAK